ncbi:hypothetical protein [Draconibacterium mangrovi]|uniref:hypothetical protein n=1 Tax=Draconibacterium mangrovi TaxID=2697469 RepID=UPI0013D3D301|nr:hypothetical protein [Draconibacterium mangrovi]
MIRTNKILLCLSLISMLACNTESKIYKRVGGGHLYLVSGNKELFWFSGIHGVDPLNPMFYDICVEFAKFAPDVVLVEGNAIAPNDSLDAIRHGESSFVAYLSQTNHIQIQSTEPTDSSIFRYLLNSCTKDEILAMYLIRQMVQWQRPNANINFEVNAVDFVNGINKTLKYSVSSIKLSQLSDLLEPYTNIEDLNNNNWTDFDAKKYLYFSKNRINEIYEHVSAYRNIYLIQLLKETLESNNRVFVMMGFDHAKELDKELQKLFDDLSIRSE